MKSYVQLLSICLFVFTNLAVQAQVKLALIDNKYAERYEIYAMHENFEFSSSNTFIGTGQITIVVDDGNELTDVTNYNGLWIMNSKAETPPENPSKNYFSFGFSEYSQIDISGSKPTFLFSVDYTRESYANIIDKNDPFLRLPNSMGTNPGNELSIAHINDEIKLLGYESNYEPCDPSPLPCELNDVHFAQKNSKKKAKEQTASRVLTAQKEEENTGRQ